MPAAHAKAHLRREALARRLDISLTAQQKASRHMMEIFFRSAPLPPRATVAGYWPVRGEMDVMPLLVALHEKGYDCALPKVVEKSAPLSFLRWEPFMRMTRGSFGIQEPDPSHSSIVTPDIILLPLLAFDANGHRLGYGQGYYDRTLRHLEREGHLPVTIGVGYAAQRFEDVPVEPHDRKMDYVVTEKKFIKTGAQA